MSLTKLFLFLYFLCLGVDLFAVETQNHQLESIFKSLLMPILAMWFISLAGKDRSNEKKLFLYSILALIFSWGGDVLLLGSELEIRFMSGLGSFLIAHIFYILAFREIPKTDNPIKLGPIVGLLMLYGLVLLAVLWNNLGDMKIPVIAYALVICTMGSFAARRKQSVHPKSYLLTFSGALVFMASDSVIAISRFAYDFPHAHSLIMITYCLAQYYILAGLSLQIRQKKAH
jgi:uncharacterized membrane protein YhhN